MSKTTTGTVATQMAAATANTVAAHNPVPFTILGYRVEPNPSEWSPKSGAYTNKRVGHALIKIGAFMFPAEVTVVFPKDGAKPKIEANTGKIRYAGKLFKPADDLPKADQERASVALSAFEREIATGFAAWYRKQSGLPALTSRVIAGSANGVDLDDAPDAE